MVAAVTGRRIKLLGCFLVTNGSVGTAQFFSADEGVAMSGDMTMGTDREVISLPYSSVGWGFTQPGAALFLELDAGAMTGIVVYEVVAGG